MTRNHTPTTAEANKANKANADTAAKVAAQTGNQAATNGTQNDDGSNAVRNKNQPNKNMAFANDVEGHGDNKANTYDLVNASLPQSGIFHKNPKAAAMARKNATQKQVIALERGYYHERLIEPGEIFEVPEDENEEWFEATKSNKKIKNADEELV